MFRSVNKDAPKRSRIGGLRRICMCGGPVSRILFPGSLRFDDHSSGMRIASHPQAANPDPCGKVPEPPLPGAVGPYSALLPVGLAMRGTLPPPRCALTAPFHPYPACRAVFSLWRCPSGCPARALPGTVTLWSPDFPRGVAPARPSGPPHGAAPRTWPRPRQRGSVAPCPRRWHNRAHPADHRPRDGT